MAFTYVPITGTWTGHTGKVVVVPVYPMSNGSNTITQTQTFNLNGSGVASFSLAATDDVGTSPTIAAYEFYLEISGLPTQVFTTVIPHAQAGAGINIITQLPWGVSTTPQGTTTAGGITLYTGAGAPTFTPNASGDYYFRKDAPTTANQRIYVYNGTSWTAVV